MLKGWRLIKVYRQKRPHGLPQRQEIAELQALINSYTVGHKTLPLDDEPVAEDLKWHASLFLAKAIDLAQPSNYECPVKTFRDFKVDLLNS